MKWKEQGSIQLTLRNPLDKWWKPRRWRWSPPPPKRSVAPAARPTVTVIRGTEVANLQSGFDSDLFKNRNNKVQPRNRTTMRARCWRAGTHQPDPGRNGCGTRGWRRVSAGWSVQTLDLSVLLFKSRIVALDAPIGRVSVGNPGHRGHCGDPGRPRSTCSGKTSGPPTCSSGIAITSRSAR